MTLDATALARARRFLSDIGSSEVQQVALAGATGGTFTLTFESSTTVALAYNAAAAVVQNALATILGVGNVTVQGSNPWLIHYAGDLEHAAQSMLTISTGSLTPGTATGEVTQRAPGGVTAFSDAELSDNDDLANNSFFMGLLYGVRQLQMDAAKFNDYTIGQTSERKDQVFQHLTTMAEWFEGWAQSNNQAQIVGMQAVPPRRKARPFVQGVGPGSHGAWGNRDSRSGGGGDFEW